MKCERPSELPGNGFALSAGAGAIVCGDMESIGETLREARHQKQVSLEDASRATKIKVDILEQLESDEFSRLVSPTYTKGFLKLYAEYLGLDSQSIVSAYLSSQGGLQRQGLHMETAATMQHRQNELHLSVRGIALVVAGLSVAALIIWGLTTWWTRPPPVEQPVAVAPVETEPAIVAVAPSVARADFEPTYQPKPTEPALLELPAAK